MHRTVKRVPLDFDHPLKEVWPGYLSPEPRPCPAGDDCIHGYTPAGDYVQQLAHLLLLVADQGGQRVGRNGLHPWLGTLPGSSRQTPGADAVALGAGLAGRDASMLGHDAIDRSHAARAIVKAAGLDADTWGTCPACDGRAYHPDDVDAQESWEPTEPPVGDGWQLWETVSEGSPTSPVFDTPERLAGWCAVNATLFAGHSASFGEWLQLIVDGEVEVASMVAFRPVGST